MISGFAQHYGITFRRPELLKLALTHRSYLSVTGQGPRDSNERLEFLGDSVLGLVTSEFLYGEHPTEHEGQLTKTKSLLVSKAILSRRALAMGLGRFVLMSHSEVESGGRQRLSILADAFEAVVGAIYLDLGFDAARQFISRWLLRDSHEITSDKAHTNYKSHLQEFVQSTYRTHPVYRIRSEMGPDHSKQFNVEVLVGRRTLGTGKGRNKKEAEQAAARDALEKVEVPSAARSRVERRLPVAEPAQERPNIQAAPTAETLDQPRRRRRGRRGGKGRHLADETGAGTSGPVGETAERETGSSMSAPTVRPRMAREPEPERPAIEEKLHREADVFEPHPLVYDEDDYEEIGRPEGPLGERHVDPYEVDVPRASREEPPAPPRDSGSDSEGRRYSSPGAEARHERESRPRSGGERPEPPAPRPDFEPSDSGGQPPAPRPDFEPPDSGRRGTEAGRPPSQYGRRGGRGRRGSR